MESESEKVQAQNKIVENEDVLLVKMSNEFRVMLEHFYELKSSQTQSAIMNMINISA